MSPEAEAGVLLAAGFPTFLVGAAFWRPAVYQQALPKALAAMAEEPKRLRWIQTWMVVGVLVTTLGLLGLAEVPGTRGVLCRVGAGTFALGAGPMVVSLVFGLTVRAWAATQTAATGQVPVGYEAWDNWATGLYAIHMLTAYTSWAIVGVALLQSVGPAWLAWSGVITGCASVSGFALLRGGPFGPPILAHVYPFVIGIVLLARG